MKRIIISLLVFFSICTASHAFSIFDQTKEFKVICALKPGQSTILVAAHSQPMTFLRTENGFIIVTSPRMFEVVPYEAICKAPVAQ